MWSTLLLLVVAEVLVELETVELALVEVVVIERHLVLYPH
jgi:hypothetical protein